MRLATLTWHGFAAVLIAMALSTAASSKPYIPPTESAVLADVPPGTQHAQLAGRQLAAKRIDVALPLAELYIKQARSNGDLRYLGYAEAVLQPWVGANAVSSQALVLHATVLQSRHQFTQALTVLQQARTLRADDAQAWLTSATVLRVLGRYSESLAACEQMAVHSDPVFVELCRQGVRGLTGELPAAYVAVAAVDSGGLPEAGRAWRDSELGEMAVRLGKNADAEHWFQNGLRAAPSDFYIRAAYSDLLLAQGRAGEVLELLKGQESLEPLLLRIAIAQKSTGTAALKDSRDRLAAAFDAEAQRGEEVHRREQARFLLDVCDDPNASLAAALANWQVQKEVDDALVLMRAAVAAKQPGAAREAVEFVRANHLQDVRLARAMESIP